MNDPEEVRTGDERGALCRRVVGINGFCIMAELTFKRCLCCPGISVIGSPGSNLIKHRVFKPSPDDFLLHVPTTVDLERRPCLTGGCLEKDYNADWGL